MTYTVTAHLMNGDDKVGISRSPKVAFNKAMDQARTGVFRGFTIERDGVLVKSTLPEHNREPYAERAVVYNGENYVQDRTAIVDEKLRRASRHGERTIIKNRRPQPAQTTGW